MEDNEQMSPIEAILRLIIGGYGIIFFIALTLNGFLSADFKQELAKEYGVPMGEFSDEHFKLCLFPIPHTEYYVVTDMGKEYLLATEYFGSISFEDENVKKFCHPEIYEEYNKFLKGRGDL